MTTLFAAFLSSICALGLVVYFQVERKARRKRRLQALELRPNCLLTRRPIAFIAGPRSVFRLYDHWNDVPSYLREHGYDILVIEPQPNQEASSIISTLEEFSQACHLIADSSSKSILEQIAQAKTKNAASLTLIQNPQLKFQTEALPTFRSVDDLKPLPNAIEVFEINSPLTSKSIGSQFELGLLGLHNRCVMGHDRKVDAFETAAVSTRIPWAIESRFLDLAISLAERDAQSPG